MGCGRGTGSKPWGFRTGRARDGKSIHGAFIRKSASRRPLLGEDPAEAFEVEDAGERFLLHDGGGEGGLLLLDDADLLLDGTGGE